MIDDEMAKAVDLQPGQFGHLPCKTLCKECPLRRDSIRGWLGGWTPEMYIKALHSDVDIACHMSAGFVEAGKARAQGGDARAYTNPAYLAEMRSCTGVAHYRANTGKLPRSSHAADAVRHVGENHDAVFSTPQEFLDHHTLAPKEGNDDD